MSRLFDILNTIVPSTYSSGSSGDWRWKKYRDGTFEATYSEDLNTGTFTQIGSSGTYYTNATELPIPSEIGAYSIRSVSQEVAPNDDYLIIGFINRQSPSSFYHGYIRFGASAAANIKERIHITGLWR